MSRKFLRKAVLMFGLLALFLAAAPAFAASFPDQWASLPKNFPMEVRAFMERRNACMYWAGEISGFAPRDAQIEIELARLRCVSIDRDEAILKKRYANNPTIIQILRISRDWDPE